MDFAWTKLIRKPYYARVGSQIVDQIHQGCPYRLFALDIVCGNPNKYSFDLLNTKAFQQPSSFPSQLPASQKIVRKQPKGGWSYYASWVSLANRCNIGISFKQALTHALSKFTSYTLHVCAASTTLAGVNASPYGMHDHRKHKSCSFARTSFLL
ncbi:hypothetical protein VNO77_42817 [Canavalia gladiata]|uniref:Uncharacterized protein n=1 Tax=Canavalia gladiata TaxID=3824 RepID=A0AAN9PPH5_CANGL